MAFAVDHFIPRTPEEVWSIVTDWTIAEYWLGVNKLRPLEKDKPIRAGSKLTFLARSTPQLMLVTAWQPREHLALQSRQGGITVDYDYTFSRTNDGTRVQLEGRCSADGTFWRLFVPIVGWMMERTDRKQLRALGKLVEATTGGGPQAAADDTHRAASPRKAARRKKKRR